MFQSVFKWIKQKLNALRDFIAPITRQKPQKFMMSCILFIAGGCLFVSFRVVSGGWKCSLIGESTPPCIHSTRLNIAGESEDSDNPLMRKKEETKKEEISQKTRIPFLSLSSSIIPIWVPVPGGYYVFNMDIKEVLRVVMLQLTYDLITEPLVDYLIEDWNQNSRMNQLVFFIQDIRDRSRLLQLECIESYSSFYAQRLQGPRYDSDWVKKEKLLHQDKIRLKWHLEFRSRGPVKMLFTRHGPIYVYPWLRDNSLKREIKERSKFETRKARRFFYKNYRNLLDTKLPLGAIVELDPSFKTRLEQSVDFAQLLSQPISGGKGKDCLRIRKDGLNVNLFFDPTTKEIKLETCESKTDESLLDCFVVVFRFKFTDPSRIKLPGPQPNNLGLWITFAFDQRENLTLKRKFCVVLIIWYYYRNRRYFF